MVIGLIQHDDEANIVWDNAGNANNAENEKRNRIMNTLEMKVQ